MLTSAEFHALLRKAFSLTRYDGAVMDAAEASTMLYALSAQMVDEIQRSGWSSSQRLTDNSVPERVTAPSEERESLIERNNQISAATAQRLVDFYLEHGGDITGLGLEEH